MDHCLATVSGSITDAPHFLSVVFVMLDKIEPYTEEDVCNNRRGARRVKHVFLIIVVQLDPFYCTIVLTIEMFLQSKMIEFG
jgi:hypothetical protein